MTPADLVEFLVTQESEQDGITLTGGEPLQQPTALLQLLVGVRKATTLSVLLFSGYTIKEIQQLPVGSDILEHVDVLIDGRYVETSRLARGLRGSSNQRVHLLTNRYRMEEIERTPLAEIRIDSRGDISITGVNPVRIADSRSDEE